jgi:hypothetical protein
MSGPIPSLPLKSVRIRARLWFSGMTIYPFLLLCTDSEKTKIHETIHYRQQDQWWRWAGPFGLLAWYFLYLFVLPFGWNRWRWGWEWEAYSKGSGYNDDVIRRILTRWGGLYNLWWMK